MGGKNSRKEKPSTELVKESSQPNGVYYQRNTALIQSSQSNTVVTPKDRTYYGLSDGSFYQTDTGTLHGIQSSAGTTPRHLTSYRSSDRSLQQNTGALHSSQSSAGTTPSHLTSYRSSDRSLQQNTVALHSSQSSAVTTPRHLTSYRSSDRSLQQNTGALHSSQSSAVTTPSHLTSYRSSDRSLQQNTGALHSSQSSAVTTPSHLTSYRSSDRSLQQNTGALHSSQSSAVTTPRHLTSYRSSDRSLQQNTGAIHSSQSSAGTTPRHLTSYRSSDRSLQQNTGAILSSQSSAVTTPRHLTSYRSSDRSLQQNTGAIHSSQSSAGTTPSYLTSYRLSDRPLQPNTGVIQSSKSSSSSNISGLPFSQQDDTTANQVYYSNADSNASGGPSGLPFSQLDDTTVHQVNYSNADVTARGGPSGLPFTQLDDPTVQQMTLSIADGNASGGPSGLPFSQLDNPTTHQVTNTNADVTARGGPSGLPFSQLDDPTVQQVTHSIAISNASGGPSGLPFSQPGDITAHQVTNSNADVTASEGATGLPFSKPNHSNADGPISEILSSDLNDSTPHGVVDLDASKTSVIASPKEEEVSIEPPSNKILKTDECLVCITLPAAVDWKIALDDLNNRLQHFEFKLQDLENKLPNHNLHSKNYVICFADENIVPRAIPILKDRKIKATPCEDLINNCVNEILEGKDKALESHRLKYDEIMQSIEGIQPEKKGNKKAHGKFIPIEQFDKKQAEKEALKQKAMELNGQTKEFVKLFSTLVDRLYSLKKLRVSWKELDSELKEARNLFQREEVRLSNALPIYAKKSQIIETVKNNQVSIILGETGSGKSTQVVQYLYDSGLAKEGSIVCTQPRKVAAFSLEKYVREEMKGSGHVVQCQVGAQKGKKAKDSKILFTTDYSLLMECIRDRDLKRFSCVIIDEAHERSINTDLLLGIIKKALPRRPDLRVIITSATIDPELFIGYFGHCPVVKVSGKIFPVDIVWKKKQENSSDYVLEAVDKVVEIHQNEAEGDVLVFLTCPAEIEQACTKVSNRLKKDNIMFLPLHGKLQQEEQNKVFEPTPKGKRKVVFSTNCAETSLTIPGIKFVIDTGKAKEMKYDPKRNLNSLEVSTISQSSADQRKGRAGRTQSGKCFRLFTEEDFKTMEKSSKPEILRVNLGQALLKLMELGISNPEDFDYVESPPVESIKTAAMELSELGATCDGHLTELGKKMAKVPVDPSLAKFLFEGFEQGVGYEALVLISVATVNGSVFFRMGTEDEKKAADKKKLEFCHLGGDFMTLLDVYRSWQKIDKRDRGRWCFKKSLNAKAMRMADETIKDLKSTLNHELKMKNIDWSSLDKETTDERLQKTLFSCFLAKLCIYTGHERKGYKTVGSGHYVKVHPSSSINFMGSNPQFIVYEKILKTSQDFLLNVTPIEESWLRDSIAEKKIILDIEEILAEVLMLAQPVRIRCSSILMKRAFEPFRSKLPDVERKVSSHCNDAPIVVQAERKSSKVDVYVPKNYTDKAAEFTQTFLERERSKLREETRECSMIAESPELRVILEKGWTVQQILMPNMYRSVVVRSLTDVLYGEDVKVFLSQFGNVTDFNFGSNMYFATYEKPEEAMEVVQFCRLDQELDYKVEPKKPRQMSHQNKEQSHLNFRLKITWLRREPKGMANVSFLKQHEEIWYEVSSISNLVIREKLARVSVDKFNERTLFINNLSCKSTKQDIKEAIEEAFSGVEVNERDIRFQYKQRQRPDDTEGQKTVLENLISKYATAGSYEVTVKQPDTSNKTVFGDATVDFLSPNEGIEVARNLNGAKCFGLEEWKVNLEVKPFLNFFDTCMKNVYEIVKADVKRKISEITKECAGNCNKSLELKERPAKYKGRIELSIVTKCLDHYLQASKEVSKCIRGEKIECTKSYQFLLGESGKDHLREIQRETGAYICPDERTMDITVYGTSEQKENARDAVYKFVQDLILKGSTVWEVSLKEDGRPRGLLKEMMSKFGQELQGLQDIEGVSKVSIHLFKQVLKIQSTTDAKGKVLREIEELAKTMAPIQPKIGMETEEETCPTCYCEIDNVSSYRLATCGHAYCMECVKLQLEAAQFPLSCTQENCPEMFTKQDMFELERIEKQLIENVMKKSLQSYVNANQDKARYCPSPDCLMVYRVTTDGQLFRCNICSTAICSSCHEPYHLGLTCKENEMDKKDPGKVSFEKWMSEKPGKRKRCPTCSAPIEKHGGCNHMQCTHCKAHICWPCMKVFPSGSDVYAHQASCRRNLENQI